ncbi:MAG TPA: molybdopterin cofactor-binding domain-containing protein [Steroidobacteraceae bacterium]|jgi:isoquinoline 1-oxidoreductase beta subunit|nr:molybdopterin cofactor-binding domain-containing protein [Steroidobacteraceae bacterium]
MIPAPTRRSFIQGALAGSLVVAFHVPAYAANEPEQATDDSRNKFAPNAFIRIDRSGQTTLVMPQVEMGQGVYTSIAMILAEELDADLATVVLQHAPSNEKLYKNPQLGVQATGNSNSIRAFWLPLRTAAAATRAVLVQAASQAWRVDAGSIRTENGAAIHDGSGRRLAYSALLDRAQKLAVPSDPVLKDPRNFKLIGSPLKRFDTPRKVNGEVVYGIDAMLPGMKFAMFAACPVFGGKVAHVDDAAAKAIDGVRQVVVLDDLVAVVGDHTWAAKAGLEALTIHWDFGAQAQLSSEDIWRQLRDASRKDGVVAKNVGDIAQGLARGERFNAEYEMPFLAHATMEPLNCTVHMRPDSCELWIGTQIIARVQQTVARLTGFPEAKVLVHNHFLGGGFGRRLEPDMALTAVRIAQHVDGPVKVIWSREEDVQHDIYRPCYRDVIEASLADGRLGAFKYKVCGSSILARWAPPAFVNGIDGDSVDAAVDMPYGIPDFRVEYVRVEPPGVPTGFWRGVGPNNNVFAIESFVDECARKVGKDPVEFRRSMLDKTPRMRAALELVVAKSDWAKPLPARVGRGISLSPGFASFLATVVEAEVDARGEVKVRRVTAVIDTGIVINPDTIEAQLQGGFIFGITAALYGEITIKQGRVQQSNFHDYRILRINETPAIEVHIIKSGEAPGGIGEAGTTGIVPALRNAIYAATGVALRRMPIDRRALAAKGNA